MDYVGLLERVLKVYWSCLIYVHRILGEVCWSEEAIFDELDVSCEANPLCFGAIDSVKVF